MSPATTTIDTNDNRNQDNQIFGDIHLSYINLCNNINSNNYDQNVDKTVSTVKSNQNQQHPLQ